METLQIETESKTIAAHTVFTCDKSNKQKLKINRR